MAEENIDEDAKKSAPKKKIGVPFTSENAKQMKARADLSRRLRSQMRLKLLETVATEGLEKYFAKAIKTGDVDLMTIVEKASKLTGVDFTSSPEAVTKVDVKSDNKVSTSGTLNITFSDAKPEA